MVHASPLALWADTAIKAPHNTRAWANLGTALEEAGDREAAARAYGEIVAVYRGAAGFEPNPFADIARRVPRTIEYVWYGYVRLANLALDAGDTATARRLYEEIPRLPALPQGGLDRFEIKSLRERLTDGPRG
jgi:predicted TPR repeat methyltransferase